MSAAGATMTKAQWTGQDDSHLIPCGESHRLQADTCRSFLAMQQDAINDGIDLQLVSSYRDFNRQLSIWNRKWRGELPLYDINDNLLDHGTLSSVEKMHAILTWSALPGASRHHWGTDLDVYDRQAVETSGQPFNLIRSEYLPGGPCHVLACWLHNHAATYHFTLPYGQYTGGVAPEPWHLSFKPMADSIVKQLTLPQLSQCLEDADLEGKSTVMAHLEEIFVRYTLNGETP